MEERGWGGSRHEANLARRLGDDWLGEEWKGRGGRPSAQVRCGPELRQLQRQQLHHREQRGEGRSCHAVAPRGAIGGPAVAELETVGGGACQG
eukprot:2242776-Pyramimonas_sp.AAC.1